MQCRRQAAQKRCHDWVKQVQNGTFGEVKDKIALIERYNFEAMIIKTTRWFNTLYNYWKNKRACKDTDRIETFSEECCRIIESNENNTKTYKIYKSPEYQREYDIIREVFSTTVSTHHESVQ